MKNRFLILIFLAFLSLLSVNAQMSYYYQGKKVNLTVDRNFVHVLADEEFTNFANLGLERVYRNDREIQGMIKLNFKSSPELSEY